MLSLLPGMYLNKRDLREAAKKGIIGGAFCSLPYLIY